MALIGLFFIPVLIPPCAMYSFHIRACFSTTSYVGGKEGVLDFLHRDRHQYLELLRGNEADKVTRNALTKHLCPPEWVRKLDRIEI